MVVPFVDLKRAAKTLPMRPKRPPIAKVPLARHGRLITGRLEALGHRHRQLREVRLEVREWHRDEAIALVLRERRGMLPSRPRSTIEEGLRMAPPPGRLPRSRRHAGWPFNGSSD